MTSKKKTTSESEIVKAAETAPATKSKTEKSKATKTTAAAKSSAATHKPATRKPVAAKAAVAAASAAAPVAAAVATQAAPVAKAAFDPRAYQQEIATEAYFQWVNRGGGDGGEREDWLRAVEIVRARYE
ncbi:DUF2934 domain-containing protein [Paludibaculum fermentans]|uniref:DUF2934 domain-containing protein n=1 Tax=Paludibaculum fermentans TaxID=1473598 RepID=A0A7S7NRX6_PALFE|nr:DUF2934 domain-containing protein [Paludibaculum fermentans]QOY88648.1 DUF2934 domain-containing protein [Paludibaculum fermentans]